MSENNSKKMSFGETLKFIVTGKKPNKKSKATTAEVDKKNSNKDTHKKTSNKKYFKKFKKKVGMSFKKAKTLITKWKKNGEDEKVKKEENVVQKHFSETEEIETPEKKDEVTTEEINTEVNKKYKNTTKKRVEKFEKEVGMSLENAKILITKWKKNGEDEKVKKGENLVQKYFPKKEKIETPEKKEDGTTAEIYKKYIKKGTNKDTHKKTSNEIKNDTKNKSLKNTTKKRVEKFEKEIGMSLEKSKTLIRKWKKNGEDEKVKKGESLIKKYFPKKEEVTDKENKRKKIIREKREEKNETTKEEKKEKKIFSRKKIVENPLSVVGISYSREGNLPDENEIEDRERTFAGISYIPFFSIFVIFTQQDSPFAQYHAWQGFAFLVVQITIATFGFFFGMLGLGFLFWISSFLLFILLVFSAIRAFQGRYISLPFITSFAKTLSGRE